MSMYKRILGKMGLVPASDLAEVKKQAQRAYAAAQITRLNSNWKTYTQTANRDIALALPVLRARSRDLAQNNEYMRKFVMMVRNNVSGPNGMNLLVHALRPDGTIDKKDSQRLEKAFAKWSKKGNCDITGRYSLRDIEHLALHAIARDGESIIIKHYGRGIFGFQLQIIDVALLDDRLNRDMPNGNRIRMGIELDTSNKPVAYWFIQTNTTDIYSTYAMPASPHMRVPAENVYHLFVPEDADQLRGVPWAHASMAALNDLGGYKEAAIIAARVGAAKMGFYTPTENNTGDPFPGASSGETTEKGDFIDEVAAGEFGIVPQGYKLEKFDPTYPHATFSDFYKTCLRGVSVGFGVAYHSLAGDLESVNLSSARVGLVEERDLWKSIQNWFIEGFNDQLYSDWLTPALLSGQLDPLPFSKRDKFDAAIWQGRRWQWVDPTKEVAAAKEEINTGLSTRAQYIRNQGYDPEEVWAELQKENDLLKDILPPETSGATQAVANNTDESGGKGNAKDQQD